MIEPSEDGPAPDEGADRPAPGPARPPSAADRVRAALEVFACSGIPTQFVLAQSLALAGIHPFGPRAALDPVWVSALTLGDTLLIALIAWTLLRGNGESPREVFLGVRPPGREAWFGLLITGPLVIGVALVLLALRWAYPPLHNVPDNPMAGMLHTRWGAALFLVVALVGGGVREELQRAFLLVRFERYLGGPLVGLLVTSVAFGAGHAIQGWDAAVATGLLGLTWGWVYLRRRSAVGPMVSHAGFNGLEVIQFLLAGAGV